MLNEIPVDAAVLARARGGDQEAGEQLIADLAGLAQTLMRDRHYGRDELPGALLRSVAVDRYGGDVHNGGHRQFVAHAEGAPAAVAECRAALRALPDTAFADLFDRFVGFVEAHPDALARMLSEAGFDGQDPVVEETDEAFFAAGGARALAAANAAWLCSLPELRPLPAAALAAEIDRLLAVRPEGEARRAERLALDRERHRQDGHFVVGQVLAGMAVPPLGLRRWEWPRCRAWTDGVTAYLLTLETDAGAALAVLDAARARLYLGTPEDLEALAAGRLAPPSGLGRLLRRRHPATPVVDVPTGVLDAAVAERTGRPLAALLVPALAAIALRSSRSVR